MWNRIIGPRQPLVAVEVETLGWKTILSFLFLSLEQATNDWLLKGEVNHQIMLHERNKGGLLKLRGVSKH